MKGKQLLLTAVFIFIFAGSAVAEVNGNKISTCVTGSGQDGEIQAGTEWLNMFSTVHRFNDNGDGTMTDKLTGLMWTNDASTPALINTLSLPPNCSILGVSTGDTTGGGLRNWYHALDYVACLNAYNSGSGYLGHNDWRLPNINELESVFNYAGIPAVNDSMAWLNNQLSGFSYAPHDANVHSETNSGYWSSTTYAYNLNYAWFLNGPEGVGEVEAGSKSAWFYVWPVRAGQIDSSDPAHLANIWKTGQLDSYYGMDDGALRQGVNWPSPRFTDNNNGTVADNLTGLIWLKDAGCIGAQSWFDALSLANNLATGSCKPTSVLPGCVWRLPNREELFSLIDRSMPLPTTPLPALALPYKHPFINVGALYWSSTTAGTTSTHGDTTYNKWFCNMTQVFGGDKAGAIRLSSQKNLMLVWPVCGQPGLFGNLRISPHASDSFYADIGHSPVESQKFTLSNISQDKTIGINPLPDLVDFLIQNDATCSNILTTVGTTGSQCTFEVAFNPDSPPGIKNTDLTISSHDPDGSNLDMPLSGIGRYATVTINSGAPDPAYTNKTAVDLIINCQDGGNGGCAEECISNTATCSDTW